MSSVCTPPRQSNAFCFSPFTPGQSRAEEPVHCTQHAWAVRPAEGRKSVATDPKLWARTESIGPLRPYATCSLAKLTSTRPGPPQRLLRHSEGEFQAAKISTAPGPSPAPRRTPQPRSAPPPAAPRRASSAAAPPLLRPRRAAGPPGAHGHSGTRAGSFEIV